MKKRHLLAFICGMMVALTVTAGLRFWMSEPTVAQSRTTLLISAAASLQDVLEELDPAFERANPSVRVDYNFGSSGMLQQQIQQGAPADIFISAAAQQMDMLERADLILSDSRRDLVTNRLVLVVPSNASLGLAGFQQLTDDRVRRIAVGEFRSVPAGQYAEELFRNLGILASLRSKFVFANNVRGVLAAVESGNVDAGVVYATDAKLSRQVKTVATAPADLHSPIAYSVAVLQSSNNAVAARIYERFLFDGQARAALIHFGFEIAK
jgi:molybdate transport system substrate-binding protein